MTDDVVVKVDWKSIGLAFGIVVGIILGAFLLWEIITFLFGTNLGRFIVGVVLLAVTLWVIFKEEE